MADDEFVKSPEFKAFLYKQKGKSIRELVESITPSNAEQLLNNLKSSMEREMKDMTLEKGRKLLEDAGVMIFPRLDLNYALVFYSFLKNNNATHKLSPKGVTKVYTRSKYNPDEGSLMIWAMYPPHKKSIIIDIEKDFGHVMTLKVEEVDPMATTEIGINVAKLNKAQIQMLIKEKEMYKMNNEIILRENDRLKDMMGITLGSTRLLTHGESSQKKDQWEGSNTYS